MSHFKIVDSSHLITGSRSSSLTDQVYRKLRQDIIEGRWRTGGVLLESELAAEFDVSKTPVREALRLLVQEEWAKVLPSRGYLVRPVRLTDISEVYDLLLMLEPTLVADTARSAGAIAIAALRAHLDDQRRELARPQGSLDAAREFHLTDIELARNHRAEVFVERLLAEVRRLHYFLPDVEAHAAAHAEVAAHEKILSAIEQRDAAAASSLMREHLSEMSGAMAKTYASTRVGKYIAGTLAEFPMSEEDFLPTEERHMRFDSAGVGIEYDEIGSGPPIVLVHGFGGNGKGELRVLEALAEDHRLISLDCRGHGQSDKPHDPAAYGPEMALDIVRLLDHLGIEKAHVVGYSTGAQLTMLLMTMHPERMLSGTLGGAPGRLEWSAEDFARIEREASEIERGSFRSIMLRLWPQGEARPSDEEIASMSASILEGKDRLALAAVRRSFRTQTVTREQVAAIEVPTLGVVGTLDPYLEQFHTLKRVMPQLRLVEIEGASHGTFSKSPEFIESLRDHLQASLDLA